MKDSGESEERMDRFEINTRKNPTNRKDTQTTLYINAFQFWHNITHGYRQPDGDYWQIFLYHIQLKVDSRFYMLSHNINNIIQNEMNVGSIYKGR